MADDLYSVELSFHYRIWNILRQEGFYIPHTNEPLVEVKAGAPPHSYGLAEQNNKPWFFQGADGMPDWTSVRVTVNGALQSRTSYTVDFRNGWITFPSTPNGTVRANFLESLCHILDEYPDDEWLEMNNLPCVSAALLKSTSRSAAITSTLSKFRREEGEIDVLARNKGERTQLRSSLYQMIAKCDLIDMSANQPLTPEGEINDQYDYSTQFIVPMRVLDPSSTVIQPRKGGSDKEKYRALILVEFEYVL
jgi:hypothetical protein